MIVLSQKWILCNRYIYIFNKNNSKWLKTIFNLTAVYNVPIKYKKKIKQIVRKKNFRNVLKELKDKKYYLLLNLILRRN